MDSCSHDYIIEGVCNRCGLEVYATSNGTFIDMSSTYSNCHSYMDSNTVQPFESDLRGLTIPEDVKTLVITLANSCPRETHRMGVRRQQLFSYIYLAYLQLGYKFDPEKLRQEMNMNQREVNMALRIISGTSSIEIPLPMINEAEPISAPVVVISPIIYLEDICQDNKIEEHYDKIFTFSKELLDKNRILLEFNPKHIAVSLVKCYLNQIGVNVQKFAKINSISDSILKQHVNRITAILQKRKM